jgi:uncharacterized membrane protein required for colicin V production
MGIVGFVAGVAVANRLVRRIEYKIDPPRSWVAVQMERRAAGYGVEISDAVTVVYLVVAVPTFVVMAMILGAIGLIGGSIFGLAVAFCVAAFATHAFAMHVTEKVVDHAVRSLIAEEQA